MYGNVYTQHKYNFRLVEYGCILYTCVVSVLSGLCVGLGGSRAVEKCKEHAGSIIKLLQLDTCVHQKTLNMKQTISVAPSITGQTRGSVTRRAGGGNRDSSEVA